MVKTKVKTAAKRTLGLSVSRKALRTVDPPISELMAKALTTPGLISFAAGLVDEASLPVREMGRIARSVLSREETCRASLQYGTTLGLKPLRQKLVQHLEALEGKAAAQMGFSAEEVLLTTGSQQALYLLADVLLDEGDIAITANPSYFVFTGTLASLGARILGVPMDEDGMQVEAVEELLARLEAAGDLPRVKFIYCTSFFQNPTGLTLSLPRRKRLLEVAKKYSGRAGHRILILEDAAYRELCYEPGPGLPSIKSMEPANQYTVLTQTFSKPFAPGLKLGYTVMPKDLMHRVLRQKGNHDFGSANLCQWLALEAMQRGDYERNLRGLNRNYREKRDLMLAALNRCMPAGTTWTRPGGGLYVWLSLPPTLDTGSNGPLFQAALEAGVLYVPGEFAFGGCAAGQVPHHHLRLCFGRVPKLQIEKGIELLGQAVQKVSQTSARSRGAKRGAR